MSVKLDIKFDIDAESIVSSLKEFQNEIKEDLQKGIETLATETYAEVQRMANQELKTLKEPFMNSLDFQEVSPGVWVISVDQSGLWIEEGIEPDTDMKPGLLKGGAKTSKEGNKYRAIPFKYGSQSSSQSTPQSQEILGYLKQNLRKQGVPFKKIEKDSSGSPKLGKLHEFNFGNVGGRWGAPGRGNTQRFAGLSIYQHKTPSGKVRRDVLVFRTVTSGPKSSGKWIHPGREGSKFLDKALIYCSDTWEQKILPEILKKWK